MNRDTQTRFDLTVQHVGADDARVPSAEISEVHIITGGVVDPFISDPAEILSAAIFDEYNVRGDDPGISVWQIGEILYKLGEVGVAGQNEKSVG